MERVTDCQGCIAYFLAERARHAALGIRCDELNDESKARCHELRQTGCCKVRPSPVIIIVDSREKADEMIARLSRTEP